MRIKMTVMGWSNMLTNKINELTSFNRVITKNVILRKGAKFGTFEGCEKNSAKVQIDKSDRLAK